MIKSTHDIDLAYDPNAVTLWKQRFDDALCDMERFEIADGRICAIGGRAATLEEIQGQYMGLFRLTPRTWRLLLDTRDQLPADRRTNIDMTSLFSLLIQSGTKVGGTATIDPWGEIDCPSDVKLYERLYPTV